MRRLQWGMELFRWMRWLTLACLLAGTVSSAIAAKTYSDNGDGTVTDPTTGLTWMRCSMGQTWSGSTCTGTASHYTFDQANALTGTVTRAWQSDWRLPNIRELQTIVDRSVFNPAMDIGVFPAVPDWGSFWSSSPYAGNSSWARTILFNYGGVTNISDRSSAVSVRLVRGGRSLGLLDIARPSTDYIDQGDGTVMHMPTRLTWQRCAVGQSWNGSTCSGTSSLFTWDAAKLLTSQFAGKSDWRLPTEDELVSLVDYSNYLPSINSALFPNTLSSYFWSGSPSSSVLLDHDAWVVNFDHGNDTFNGYRSFSYGVRLVRGGQCLGPLVLSVSTVGTGQITSSQGIGIQCDSGASGYYAGDVVTLTANPVANLISWGGACASAGTAATCTVTVDAAMTVSASFKDTPLVSGLPDSLNFALQNIATTSVAQTLTLSNTGGAVLNIGSIVTIGDFAHSTTCGATLTQTVSCNISVTFTPTAGGNRTGTVTVISDAPGSPHSVGLSGTSPSSPRLINLSTRGQVQTGDNVMIGGFIIGGAMPKKVFVRAVGPNLANYGISGVLADPSLQLFAGQTAIASNDDWGSSANKAEIEATNLAPAHAKESAILTTLNPGAYTAIVTGVGNTTGVGIVEVFEVDNPEVPLVNISTRGLVQTGDNVMIGGFIIQGSASQTVLIRAVGPNLANSGVAGALANPKLDLYSGQTVIASNDNWQTASNAAAISASGLAPVNPLESAILITLQPGAYTAIVSGSDGGSGVGMVEVFAQ